jgi:ATP-binding cassette subfamily C (CFTR/MRP) protein 1
LVITMRSDSAQRAWNERIENRVAMTASMLSDMKAVKILGITGVLRSVILQLRDDEHKASEKFRILGIAQIMTGE